MKLVQMICLLILFACVIVNGLTLKGEEEEALIIQLCKFDPKGTTPIDLLKIELNKYIATPWDMRIPGPIKDYSVHKMKTAGEFNITALNNAHCKDANIKKAVCQAHGGNLLEHTQWTTLNIRQWKVDKNEIMEGVNYKKALIAAFLHDIGKGGDCNFDIYDKTKYPQGNTDLHTVTGYNFVSGKTKFSRCPSTNGVIDIQAIFKPNLTPQEMKEIEVAVYLHWEFGKLNFPPPPAVEEKAKVYLKAFSDACKQSQVKPTIDLLKLCMAVSSADISGSTRERLKNSKPPKFEPLKEIYLSFDPWVAFKMQDNYLNYRKLVLQEFAKMKF